MRIAAFQRRPIFDDAATSAEALFRDLCWAEMQGVELALFPECHLLGHSYRETVIAARAQPIEGELWRTVLARIAPIATSAIVGAFERRDGHIANSAFFIDRGRIIGRYAKAHPNECGVTAGVDFPIFTQSGISFGINICNDANYPNAAQRIADAGAALICYPLNNMMKPATAALWRVRSVENLQARARQTGCWIMSADIIGQADGRICHGCTVIVSPDGEIVARVSEDVEGVAVFELPPVSGRELG
jgi:predicted amidohydrolase